MLRIIEWISHLSDHRTRLDKDRNDRARLVMVSRLWPDKDWPMVIRVDDVNRHAGRSSQRRRMVISGDGHQHVPVLQFTVQ